ncbi:MAG: hypothetical protein HY718_03245 [Planctomycetes bacterium]|nr:hypothetical protein [Planctomycetota bacterium]
MQLLFVGVGLLLASGLVCLMLSRRPRAVAIVGPAGAVAAALLGIVPALRVVGGEILPPVQWAWSVPYGSLTLALDGLSAWFLIPVLVVGGLAAIYGARYLGSYARYKALGPPWFFYNVLMASMIVLVLARNGMLFLVAWELMSLASFFLVMFEAEQESVRRAGWIYLVATHLGTAFLLALFVLLGQQAGSLDFALFGKTGWVGGRAGLLFLLAIIGFGTKAGFMPMHVWLPEAHPAAPSHVSAVMSGVMIKMGIYGIVRTLTFLGSPAAWWGWVLIAIGLTSGLLGVLFALAQHDLKRLLAYHSVENIGIIALGLGVGILGQVCGSPVLALLGFGGGLLHVLNHALFKALLFLGAGAVAHGAGTRDLDRLGGLLRRMPVTGVTFVIGAAAICGLPPLNGFVSEFLVYAGALHGIASLPVSVMLSLLAVVPGLALIGGLAVACFTKAFGIVFLGEPRTPEAAGAHEVDLSMRLPLVLLAAGCVGVGLLAPLVVGMMAPMLAAVSGVDATATGESLAGIRSLLGQVAASAVLLLAVIAFLAACRRRLLAGRPVTSAPTWDCGYAAPTARMQYTASSIAQPLIRLFDVFLRSRLDLSAPRGYFPQDASLHTDTPDVFQEHLFQPTLRAGGRLLAGLHWLQHGHVQVYVLYIALALLAALVWKLG